MFEFCSQTTWRSAEARPGVRDAVPVRCKAGCLKGEADVGGLSGDGFYGDVISKERTGKDLKGGRARDREGLLGGGRSLGHEA